MDKTLQKNIKFCFGKPEGNEPLLRTLLRWKGVPDMHVKIACGG
jgi:hypothetical protein